MMLRDWWYRGWHALPWRRALDAEIHLSKAQRALADERLRDIEARLSVLELDIAVRTERRRTSDDRKGIS